MYIPKHFAQTDRAELHALMQANPFAALVTHTAAGLNANHLPFHFYPELGEHGVLRAHLALANPVVRELEQATPGHEALVIFQGHHGYISPSLYATKAEHGKVVPTWNYAVVHAYGRVQLQRDPAWLAAQVTALTNEHEASLPQPWAVSDAPPDYIENMLKAVVGLEIHLTRLEGKWKASQNQVAANQASVVAGLGERDPHMAELVAASCTNNTR